MNRDDRKVFLHAGLIALFVVIAAAAFASDNPDCRMVRAKVREHGKVAAYAWALANGYSPKDIARIRKQCNV